MPRTFVQQPSSVTQYALTTTQRKATLVVNVNGSPIDHVVSAQWSGGFNQPYNEAKVVVTQFPAGFDSGTIQNQPLVIVAGNGTNHAIRFSGMARSPIYSLDGTITLQGVSKLAQLYEWQNSESPLTQQGGLLIFDLVGTTAATDADVVKAVLTKVLGSGGFTAGNIGGTGKIFGQFAIAMPDGSTGVTANTTFMWSAGTSLSPIWGAIPGVGESALDYIQRWDRVSAVHPGPYVTPLVYEANGPGPTTTAAVGFYRTYETLAGIIHRSLIGGRPRGTPTIATPFIEGVDIRVGNITRGYPIGNRFIAIGYDFGDGSGPARFASQGNNIYMDVTRKITCPPISSPMIEKSNELLPGDGMSCEVVTYAMEPDLNRIIVSGTVVTGRDDYVSHGATITVQAPGGSPGHLGTGEKVWVQAVRGSVSYNNGFVQEFEILGGGVPDDFLPPVAQ